MREGIEIINISEKRVGIGDICSVKVKSFIYAQLRWRVSYNCFKDTPLTHQSSSDLAYLIDLS